MRPSRPGLWCRGSRCREDGHAQTVFNYRLLERRGNTLSGPVGEDGEYVAEYGGYRLSVFPLCRRKRFGQGYDRPAFLVVGHVD